MSKIDAEKLKAMTAHERHQLWLNARKRAANKADAKLLVELIENSGLDYLRDRRPSVSLDDKIGRAMRALVNSDAGQTAMLFAQSKGRPPLAGVDPMLKAALGDDYCKENEATIQAGYIVTRYMEAKGYCKAGTAALPPGCVAKTGQLFRLRSK
jgi:hypothetical protein